jgi:CHAT domain-containing protein/tetratricopeptide (TPR) repeat protein
MTRFGAALACFAFAAPAWSQAADYVEALRKARAGDTAAAVDGLRTLIRNHAEFARAYVALASLAPRELLDSDPTSATEYFARGVARTAQNDIAGAEADLRRSISLRPDFLPAYSELILHFYRRRALSQARSYLEALPTSPGSLYALGYLHLLLSDWRKSLEYLEQASGLLPRRWEIADVRYFVYYRSDQFREALAVLEGMLEQASEEGDLEWRGRILGRAGMIHSDQGEYERAVDELAEALRIAHDLGNRSGEAVFKGNLAAALLNSGRYSEALSEAREAMALSRELKNRRDEGRNLSTIANVHAETAQYNLAIQNFTRAIEIAREMRDRPSEADQHASLALIFALIGESDRALSEIRAAIGIAASLDNSWLSGRFEQILGSVQRGRGNLKEARKSYDRAIAIARIIGDKPGEAMRLAQAGEIDAALGHPAGARARYERAVQLADEMGAPAIQTQALNHLAGWYERRGLLAQARGLFQRSLDIALATRQPEALWRAHAGMASSLGRTNRTVALEHYKQAVSAIEQVRQGLVIAEEKAGFLGDKVRVFQDYVATLVKAGRAAEAFQVAEQSRARALLDLIAESRSGAARGIDPSLVESRRDVESRLARLQARFIDEQGRERPDARRIRALEQELARAEARRIALHREIREKHPAFSRFEYPEPADLATVQRQLDNNSLLLEYVLGDSGGHLFAVGRRQFKAFRLRSAELAGRVRAVRTAIAAGPSRAKVSDYVLHARALYDELIAPADALLAGKDHLIIAADGVLRYLPFEVLLRTGVANNFLVRDFAVSYVPSAGVLHALRQRRPPNRGSPVSLIAFGDPDYRQGEGSSVRWAATPLKHSRHEVETIRDLYPSGRARVFLGPDAKEENVRSLRRTGSAALHFSTHALLNEKRPQFSGLMLSRGDLLQVYEVLNLDLDLELAVLSACETGLGKDVRGEGLTGLTQAFLYAGAPAVLVSLWKVDDRSTAELMIAFHRRLREGKLGKAQALRQAQLKLIGGEFGHPYYWAPFILTGDGT